MNEVRYETRGEIAIVTIDRPEVRNAVDGSTAAQLADAFRRFDEDDEPRRRRAHRRRRNVLRRCRPQGRRGARVAVAQPRAPREGDGPMGPTRMLLVEAGDRGGRRLRRRRRPRAGRVVRPARRGARCRLRRLLPSLGRAARRRRHDPPAAPARSQPRARPHPHRPRRLGRRGAAHGTRQPPRRAGEALPKAIELAKQLAAFPQLCMRNDRLSSYRQWALPLDDALLQETRLGLEVIRSGETVEGARRFAAGAGRHGSFR